MIKMVITGRRRPGMTLAQLHRYMLEVHGPMVVGHIQRDAGAVPQRYVQNHAFDSFYIAQANPTPLSLNRDFVTQVWFDDMPQAMAALQQPFYLTQLQPDEDNFVDQSSVVKLPVLEKLVSGPSECSANFKALLMIKRPAASTLEQFHKEWGTLSNHLSQSLTQSASGLVKHVQCTVLHRPTEEACIDGINECWFSSKEQAVLGLEHMRQTLSQQTPAGIDCTMIGNMIGIAAEEHALYV